MRKYKSITISEKKFDSYLNDLCMDYVDFTIDYLLNHKFTWKEKIMGKNKGKGGLILGIKMKGKEAMRATMIKCTKDKITEELNKKNYIKLDEFCDLNHIMEISKVNDKYYISVTKSMCT